MTPSWSGQARADGVVLAEAQVSGTLEALGGRYSCREQSGTLPGWGAGRAPVLGSVHGGEPLPTLGDQETPVENNANDGACWPSVTGITFGDRTCQTNASMQTP